MKIMKMIKNNIQMYNNKNNLFIQNPLQKMNILLRKINYNIF